MARPDQRKEKIDLYAKALAVIYPPIDEDFGYVTLEAMLARKPIVVCLDSGGPLEFVRNGENGLIVEPNAEDLAPVSYTHLTLPTIYSV